MNTIAEQLRPVMDGVLNNITGRSADPSRDHINTRRLAALAVLAGDGDTLEIGSYFGVSAIMVSIAKQLAGVTGRVYCIDPFDGREQMIHNQPQEHTNSYDSISGEYWTADTFKCNCTRNGADVHLIQKPSIPFPDEMRGKMFKLAYIDGDHWHDAPINDWYNVRDITAPFVVLDDADDNHPHVMRAVDAAKQDPDWELYWHTGGLCVFERVTK